MNMELEKQLKKALKKGVKAHKKQGKSEMSRRTGKDYSIYKKGENK